MTTPTTGFNPDRYAQMQYRRCGRSGLQLPAISLGLWNNFGHVDDFKTARSIVRTAFDLGIFHFDLANNYGPPPGSAEENFGRILAEELGAYRDELIISSKAGYRMWPGPYGEWGSRKYLLASLDQSLKRMKLDYVDVFYSHRFDPDTALEETMGALDSAVRQGKALYAGVSSYQPEQTARAAMILRELGTPCVIHQPSYSILNRWIEKGLLETLSREGIGCIAFCPLDQGVLTGKYLHGIAPETRAGKPHGTLRPQQVTEQKLSKVRALHDLAKSRGQSLAQMSLAWVLRHPGMTSALIGASKPEQVADSVGCLKNLEFSAEELATIDRIAPV